MAANVLRSEQAVHMSVYVVRAFVQQRERLAANVAILKKFSEIDKTLLDHDQVLRVIWEQLQPLLSLLRTRQSRGSDFIGNRQSRFPRALMNM